MLLALVTSLCAALTLHAQRASAVFVVRASLATAGDFGGRTGVDVDHLDVNDLWTQTSEFTWATPNLAESWPPATAAEPVMWINNPASQRGWRTRRELRTIDGTAGSRINGLATDIEAGWFGGGIAIRVNGFGIMMRPNGRPASPRSVRLPWTMVHAKLGNSYPVDVDPLTAKMEHNSLQVAPFYTGSRAKNDGTLEVSFWATNMEDKCLYEKASLPVGAGTGLSAVPLAYRSWVRRQVPNPATGKCDKSAKQLSHVRINPVTGALELVTVSGSTLRVWELVDDPNGGWQQSGMSYEYNPIRTGLPEPVQIADGSAFGDPGSLLFEDAIGNLYETGVNSATGDPAGDLVRVQLPDLPQFAPPLPPSMAGEAPPLTAVNWGGHHVVVDETDKGVVIRETNADGGASWTLGNPNGTTPSGDDRLTLSVPQLAPGSVSTPWVDVVITLHAVDGRVWQKEVRSPTSPTASLVASQWFEPLSADPDFPVVSTVTPPKLFVGESVQAWTVAPMKPGVSSQYLPPNANDLSDKSDLLLAKTQSRILALPLRADNLGPQAGAQWKDVSPPGLPPTSDGGRLGVFFNGDRGHQVVVDDASGNPFVVPLDETAIGACYVGVDTNCVAKSGTPHAYSIGQLAPSTSATSESVLGNLHQLIAPPQVTYEPGFEPGSDRWVLSGVGKGGRAVQDVWTPQTDWTGWYASDVLPGQPAVGGNIASAGRVVSAQAVPIGHSGVNNANPPSPGTLTAWTRLDRLASGRQSIEVHLGGVAPDKTTRLPTRAFGFPVPAVVPMIDSPTPVINGDGSVTLFAVTDYAGVDSQVMVARLDPVTGRLSAWLQMVQTGTGQALRAGAHHDGQSIGAVESVETWKTDGTITGYYTMGYRNPGDARNLSVLGVQVNWRPGAADLSVAFGRVDNFDGTTVYSAPALVLRNDGKVLLAYNGSDGVYFVLLSVDYTGQKTGAASTGPYQMTSSLNSTIDRMISPNLTLDDYGRPQIGVVDHAGRAIVGWVYNDSISNYGIVATQSGWGWDVRADNIATTTTQSVGILAPGPGKRELVMTNPLNNAVDHLHMSPNEGWSTAFTSNRIQARPNRVNADTVDDDGDFIEW